MFPLKVVGEEGSGGPETNSYCGLGGCTCGGWRGQQILIMWAKNWWATIIYGTTLMEFF